jgi:SAM-dependent methyltransferase
VSEEQPLRDGAVTTVSDATALKFTGERIVPGETAEILFRQHEERYVFAAQYVVGKDVLDVACGTGVGTSFLHRMGARKVWGLDIDSNAVAFARSRYVDCDFAQGDATDIFLPDCSVDVVVSFETLEHLRNQQKFLLECHRVLRTRGILICSTPNERLSRWGKENPFHFRELTIVEFNDLLASIFVDVQLYAQRSRIYPLYVLRKLLLGLLDKLHLIGLVNRVLPRSPSVTAMGRMEFTNSSESGIKPHRPGLFEEPTYVVGVACKR